MFEEKIYFPKVGSVTLCLLISLREKISIVGFVLPVASMQFSKFQHQQAWRMYSRILCSCTIVRYTDHNILLSHYYI